MRQQLVHLFGGVTMAEVKAMIADATNSVAVAAKMFGVSLAEVRANAEAQLAKAKGSYQEHLDLVDYLQDQLVTARANAEMAKAVQDNAQKLVDNLPAADFAADLVPVTPIALHLHIADEVIEDVEAK